MEVTILSRIQCENLNLPTFEPNQFWTTSDCCETQLCWVNPGSAERYNKARVMPTPQETAVGRTGYTVQHEYVEGSSSHESIQ